jgi:hypothetical protein
MKFTNFDWALLTAVVLYLALIGPWLISAASNIAVGLGIVFAIALVVLVVKRVKYHTQEKKDE